MEWTVELAQPHYVRITTRGEFSVADHLAMIEDILTRPFWEPGTATLFDNRQLDMAGATYTVMAAASQNHLRHDTRIGAGKTAVVMGSAADFGSARQFEMLVEGKGSTTLRVFLDPVAALSWLTAEPETPPSA